VRKPKAAKHDKQLKPVEEPKQTEEGLSKSPPRAQRRYLGVRGKVARPQAAPQQQKTLMIPKRGVARK
jgi:hypothetical protein